jgi:hypothetical protein
MLWYLFHEWIDFFKEGFMVTWVGYGLSVTFLNWVWMLKYHYESIENTKNFLSSSFDMKDLGIADVILGIRIVRNENELVLNQSHYIEKVLKRFNQFDCKPVCTPFDASMKLYHNIGRAVNQLEYARVIGCLMYAMTCTTPDIAYAMGKMSRYISNPSHIH